MEFILVAIIAVLVLGAGGWWVVKTRAEKAEQARIAAEAKAEADRKAAAEKTEAERRAAEEKRLAEERRRAEEAEKARLAAAEKAEAERRENLQALLRSRLAELNVTADELLREEPARAARQLAELKSDERSLARDADAFALHKARARVDAQQDYVDRLDALLARHPAKLQQARATELLSVRQPEQAEIALGELTISLAALEKEIGIARRTAEQRLSGALVVDCSDADVAWTFTDAFGEKHAGTGSGRLERVATGSGELIFSRPGWPAQRVAVVVRGGQTTETRPRFNTAILQLATVPAGATYRLDNGVTGTTPATLTLVPGDIGVTLELTGYQGKRLTVKTVAGETSAQRVELAPQPLLTDQELARFIATLPRSNVVSDVAVATWTAVRASVLPTDSGRDIANICLVTFRPISLTMSQPAPSLPVSAFFASAPAPAAPRSGAVGLLGGGLVGLAVSRSAATAEPAPGAASYFDTDGHGHVVLTGLLDRGNLTWVGKPNVVKASAPALADAAINWLRTAEFQYTGAPAAYHPLVFIVVKFRKPAN